MATSTVITQAFPDLGCVPSRKCAERGFALPRLDMRALRRGVGAGDGPHDPRACSQTPHFGSTWRANGSHPCDCVPAPWVAAGLEVEPDSLHCPPSKAPEWYPLHPGVRSPWGGDKEERCSHDADPDWARSQGPSHRSPGCRLVGPVGTVGLASGCALPGDPISSSSSSSLC